MYGSGDTDGESGRSVRARGFSGLCLVRELARAVRTYSTYWKYPILVGDTGGPFCRDFGGHFVRGRGTGKGRNFRWKLSMGGPFFEKNANFF